MSAIFGLHVDPSLPVGTVVTRPGPFMAASGRFLITVTGKGGHAAMPHSAVDPIVMASSAIISLQQIVAREIDPLEAAVCDLHRMRVLACIILSQMSSLCTFVLICASDRRCSLVNDMYRLRIFQVVSVTFMKGGDAYNVIPESACFGGTFRSLTTEGLSYLKKRIKEVNQSNKHFPSPTYLRSRA